LNCTDRVLLFKVFAYPSLTGLLVVLCSNSEGFSLESFDRVNFQQYWAQIQWIAARTTYVVALNHKFDIRSKESGRSSSVDRF
jgi:hypothetical protein